MFLHLPCKKTVFLTSDQLVHILSESRCEAYFTNEGRIVNHVSDIQSQHVFLNVRLCGGKGAFGSLLRFIGSQIEKTTNREAMRDLSGRRLHDVNNEQRLQDWNERQQERERQREVEKEERLQKLRDGPKHNFTDQKYFDQSASIRNNLEDALSTALQSAGPSNGSQSTCEIDRQKRNSAPRSKISSSKSKKSRGIMDMGLPDDSDSDSDSSEASEGSVPVACESRNPKQIKASGVENKNTDKTGCHKTMDVKEGCVKRIDAVETDCQISLETGVKETQLTVTKSEPDKDSEESGTNHDEASNRTCEDTSDGHCQKTMTENEIDSESRKRKSEPETTSLKDDDYHDLVKRNKVIED